MNVHDNLEDTPTPTWTEVEDYQGEEVVGLEGNSQQSSPIPYLRIIIWTTLITLLSAIAPVLLGVTSLQYSADSYVGWALHQGGDIYTDFFGTEGLLYYLLQYIVKGSIVFAALYWLALLGSGIFLFRAATAISKRDKQVHQLLVGFYLLAGGLSFGGGYATILALPFLFYGLDLALAYMVDSNNDKGFLRIGMSMALAFFLAPLPTVLYSLVLFLALSAFNIVRRRLSHGLYQLFAAGLGFSIVFYPIGYYTVYKGSFGSAISQILYPIDSLNIFSNLALLDNLFFYGLLTLSLGTLVLIFTGFFQSKPVEIEYFAIFSGIALILQFVLLIFSTEPIHGSRLVVYLPFMTILLLARIGEKKLKGADRRRRYRRESTLLGDFLRINAYLPIFAFIYLVAAPLVGRYVLHQDLYQERGRIESIVKEQTKESDSIYIWDDQVDTYQSSERLSASHLLTPNLHTSLAENQTILLNDLRENKPKMIVVNTKLNLWKEVEQLLTQNYQQVQSEFTDFKLYKLK